jgi:hypothetical protein
MKRSLWPALAGVSLWLAASPAVSARTLEEILRDKEILTDEEARELKEANESAKPGVAAVPDWVRKITPLGDVRVRNESFFRDGDRDRIRQRFRLRFGAKFAANDWTEIGFRLASGPAGDPIGSNQSFTETFTPKSINLNTAYARLAPAAAFGRRSSLLTLLGGKFETPTTHPTPLLFDYDLAPEGFFESVKAVDRTDGFLRSLGLGLGQWIYQENADTGDGAAFAFQGTATLAPTKRLTVNLVAGDFLFQKASTIAAARNRNSALVITNFVRLSDGSVVGARSVDPAKLGPNGNGIDADGNPIRIVGFVSDFNVLDAGGELVFDTGSARWPVRLIADFVHNTEASSGDDSGFQAGFGVGGGKNAGDLGFRYAYERLETDAVISAFSDSDLGDGGTNIRGHVVQVTWQIIAPLQFGSTAYFTEPIENVPGRKSNTLTRWQVDLLAKF